MSIVFKLLATIVSLGAGFMANKLIDTVWEKTTGQAPPKDGEDMTYSLRSVLTFAVVSAGVSAVIQTLAGRGAQKAIARFQDTRDQV